MYDEGNLDDVNLLMLDYDAKVKLLEKIIQELLKIKTEYARVSGKAAELRATVTVLRETKSALQSAIRAEPRG